VTDKIRILVADDSAFMRKFLTNIIESEPTFEVVKTAKNGLDALRAVERLKPDVITLDIEMPEIDGLTALVYIMEDFPTPVIMITGFSKFLGEDTIKALEYGAVGFVRKPKGPAAESGEKFRRDLIEQITIATNVDIAKLKPLTVEKEKVVAAKPVPKSAQKIVVIASSSGGPRALSSILPQLPADLKAGVLVVQHMPGDFIPAFAERLDRESALRAKVAEDREPIQQGMILIAPADFHCVTVSNGIDKEVIKLTPFGREKITNLISADETMISLAPLYGKNAIGVVLTGMGKDGTKGLEAIKENGGHTIAEAESTAIVFGMPKAAIDAEVIDKVIPLQNIAEEIVRLVKR